MTQPPDTNAAMQSTDVVWQDPPARPPRRVDTVATQLRLRPGVWALIQRQEGMVVLPWWGPLHDSPLFEMRIVRTTDRLFGPCDIYAARAVADPSRSPGDS